MTTGEDEEFWLRLPPGSRIWLLDDDNRVVCATVTPHSGFGTIEWWPDDAGETEWLDARLFTEAIQDGTAGVIRTTRLQRLPYWLRHQAYLAGFWYRTWRPW